MTERDPFDAELERLRAENERLRAENERLRAEMDQRMAAYIEYQERDEAEIKRLRAENQTAWNKADELDERARHAEAALRRALERKP